MDLWTCGCSAMLPWSKPASTKRGFRTERTLAVSLFFGSPQEARGQMGDRAHLRSQGELRNWTSGARVLPSPTSDTSWRFARLQLVALAPLSTRSLLPCCHSKERLRL